MDWRWNARRAFISAFLVFHVTIVSIWVLPPCPLKHRVFATASYYMLPLGLWQYWAMFSPDPVRDTIMLEAQVIDSKGLRYTFAFPRLADYSAWQGIPRFRYSKYVANLAGEDFDLSRKFAARHAVRHLNLASSAYPIEVHLLYQVRTTPPPGEPPADPMTPTKPHLLARFQFDTPAEVRP